MNILNSLSGAITTDIIIIFVVFFLLFLYSIRFGKSKSTSLLISLYIGILAFLSLPYIEEVTLLKSSEAQVTISHIAVFIIGVFIIHTAISRVIYIEYPNRRYLKYIEIGLLSGAITGLFFAFLYNTIPFATIYDFGNFIDNLFSSQYFFWWLIAPIVVLFITSRR